MKHPVDRLIYDAHSALAALEPQSARSAARVTVSAQGETARRRPRTARSRFRTLFPGMAVAAALAVLLGLGIARLAPQRDRDTVALSQPFITPTSSQQTDDDRHDATHPDISPVKTIRRVRVAPHWLPEGYQVGEPVLLEEDVLQLTAQNEPGDSIRIRVAVAPESEAAPTPAPQERKTTVQGHDAVLSESEEGGLSVRWLDPALSLQVEAQGSQLDEETLLRVAENVELGTAESDADFPTLSAAASASDAAEAATPSDAGEADSYIIEYDDPETEYTGWRAFVKYPDQWCENRWALEHLPMNIVEGNTDPMTWESFSAYPAPCSEEYYQQWVRENGHYFAVLYGLESPVAGEESLYYEIFGDPRNDAAIDEFVALFGHMPRGFSTVDTTAPPSTYNDPGSDGEYSPYSGVEPTDTAAPHAEYNTQTPDEQFAVYPAADPAQALPRLDVASATDP